MMALTMQFPAEHKRALWSAIQCTVEAAQDPANKPTVTPYFDATGNLLFARVRIDTKDGKIIRPFHLDGDCWKQGEPAFEGKKPLLNLPLLAAHPGAEVWLVEGEKCAAVLTDAGKLATTSGGATTVVGSDWTPLSGRRVVVWPDFDEPGAKWLAELIPVLQKIGATVRVVDIEQLELGEGDDSADWLPQHGVEALDSLPMIEVEALVPAAARVELVRADQIKIEPIRWLWDGWLACGKLHILAGAPGTGKTTIAMTMAATVTRGGRWPDGSRCARGSVLVWSGEDDPQDTLVPRLVAAGADLSRVFFVTGTRAKPDEVRPFDPAADLDLLQRTVRQAGDIRLMVVDPVVSVVTGDSHKNTEVRRALQPLVEMAGALGCALVGITHFSKGTGGKDPAERVTGSIAFTALARVVLVAAKREDDDGERSQVLARAKSNIGQDHGGFAYAFEQVELAEHPGVFASRVRWGEALAGEARELLGVPEAIGDSEGSSLADAKRFLYALLEDGPVSSKTVKVDADGAGHSWATIRRAQKAMGVLIEKEKGSTKGGWYWRLPDNYSGTASASGRCSSKREDAQPETVSTFGKVEHLREDEGDDLDDWLAEYDCHDDELTDMVQI